VGFADGFEIEISQVVSSCDLAYVCFMVFVSSGRKEMRLFSRRIEGDMFPPCSETLSCN
jgi:hypothetical protein